MKKDKKGKDIYLQLEFADFEAGVFPTGFAFINREGDFCREADGDKQLINGFTWNRPHPPEEIGTTASGGAIYLELPEEVCAPVNREREKWFNHWAENQLAKHKAKFKKTCRGLSEGEIRTKIKAELIWVNFLLEPTIHPEPPRYEYQNSKLPKRIATEYYNILTFGRNSFWEKYRTLTECQSAHPPGGSYDNSVIIAEGFIRYRDHLNKLLTEPGTTDSISETQAELKDLFFIENWMEYIDLLCDCEAPVLKREGSVYTFIGNAKTESGIVAAFIQYLKNKGIVNSNFNRDAIADVLTHQIKNFKVSGPTITNVSRKYETHYQKHLEEEVKRLKDNKKTNHLLT